MKTQANTTEIPNHVSNTDPQLNPLPAEEAPLVPDADNAPLTAIEAVPLPLNPEVVANKELRRGIDAQLQKLKGLPPSRERALAVTKLQEAVMWLGMDLKRLNEPNPYPNSKDPSNDKIDATADGLKL